MCVGCNKVCAEEEGDAFPSVIVFFFFFKRKKREKKKERKTNYLFIDGAKKWGGGRFGSSASNKINKRFFILF